MTSYTAFGYGGGMPRAKKNKGGRPSREEAGRLTEHLYDVACQAFCDQGFSGATMDGIAKAASIGKQTLYNRFKDKDALFLAVVRSRTERDFEQFVPTDRSMPFDQAVKDLAHSYSDIMGRPENRGIMRLLRAEAHRFPQLLALVHAGGWRRFRETVLQFFEDYAAQGSLTGITPLLATEVFFNLMIGEEERRMWYEGVKVPLDRTKHLNEMMDVFLRVAEAPRPATTSRRPPVRKRRRALRSGKNAA